MHSLRRGQVTTDWDNSRKTVQKLGRWQKEQRALFRGCILKHCVASKYGKGNFKHSLSALDIKHTIFQLNPQAE